MLLSCLCTALEVLAAQAGHIDMHGHLYMYFKQRLGDR